MPLDVQVSYNLPKNHTCCLAKRTQEIHCTEPLKVFFNVSFQSSHLNIFKVFGHVLGFSVSVVLACWFNLTRINSLTTIRQWREWLRYRKTDQKSKYLFAFFEREECHVEEINDSKKECSTQLKLSVSEYFAFLYIVYLFCKEVSSIYEKNAKYTLNGDLDACQFNFKCLHPKFEFVAFNHMLSGIGYMISGIGFLCEIGRAWKGQSTYIVWFALAISTISIGISSAAHTMCPNPESKRFGK